jgi:type II secretory pathway component PulF
VLAAVVALEILGNVLNDRVPTFTQIVLFFTHHVVTRWMLFGLWIWIGVHFYLKARQ